MSHTEEKELTAVFTKHNDSSSLAIGKTGLPLEKKNNLHIGYYAGFNTKQNNTIVIGSQNDCHQDNSIKIGDSRYTHVQIGIVDLIQLVKQVEYLEKRVSQLEDTDKIYYYGRREFEVLKKDDM